jgi:hypothetical protein
MQDSLQKMGVGQPPGIGGPAPGGGAPADHRRCQQGAG